MHHLAWTNSKACPGFRDYCGNCCLPREYVTISASRLCGTTNVTPYKVHLMKTNLRCPLCSKALNQEEYDEAAKRLKLLEYRRTAPPRQTREVKKLGLTQRELEIVATLIAGYSNKNIAKHFHISEFTVKHHLSNIFDKIGVSTRLELALFALSRLAGASVLRRKW